MTGNELITNLGLRLEDPNKTVFTEAAVLEALNTAQRTICNTVDNSYLTELQTIKNDQALSSGSVSFSTASIDPIRGAIVGVYDEDNDLWCTMIEPGEVKSLENSYLTSNTTNAVFYVFGSTIYVKPTTISTIDIWYLKAPTNLAADAVECELNIALQEVLLDFAEAQLWRMDNKGDRAASAYNSALSIVKTLNERYYADKPQAIGTKGR